MAITAIKDLGTSDTSAARLTYNGYEFGNIVKFDIDAEYEYDEAGRTIKFTRYTLSVRWFIYGDGSQASALTRLISEPGKRLTITGLGSVASNALNGFDINAPGNPTQADVEWGPKPQGLNLVDVGGQYCWEAQWRCTFSIKTSENGVLFMDFFKSFTYERVDTFDETGKCTRIYSGTIEIAQTRRGGGRDLRTSVDNYRHFIRVGIPRGFKRVSQTFAISRDKSRMDFTVVDQELPNEASPMPNGCIRADIEFSIENNPASGFAQYSATLAGTIEVAQGYAPNVAGETFVRIALDRIVKLRAAVRGKGIVLPQRIRFAHRLFSNESSFAMTFLVTHCLGDLLSQGGIWEPIQGHDWQQWKDSMARAWSVRGAANLIYNFSEDAIVDLGSNAFPQKLAADVGQEGRSYAPQNYKFSVDLTEGESWIAYENSLRVEREHPHSVHVPAEKFEPQSPGTSPGSGTRMPATVANGTQYAATLQRRGKPVDKIIMYGKSMRVGFKPEIPRLKDIGGVPVNEIEAIIDGPHPRGCIFGKPVYVARWRITYVATGGGYISEIPPQKNPSLCCDEQQAT